MYLFIEENFEKVTFFHKIFTKLFVPPLNSKKIELWNRKHFLQTELA